MPIIAILGAVLALTVFHLRRNNSLKSIRYLAPPLIFLFLVESIAYLAADYFTDDGIDVSVI
jgi:hypothetical protein